MSEDMKQTPADDVGQNNEQPKLDCSTVPVPHSDEVLKNPAPRARSRIQKQMNKKTRRKTKAEIAKHINHWIEKRIDEAFETADENDNWSVEALLDNIVGHIAERIQFDIGREVRNLLEVHLQQQER